MTNNIINEDFKYIFDRVENKDKFRDSTILITGCAGFLGFYFMGFLAHYAMKLGIKRIIGLDNFMLQSPKWIDNLQRQYAKIVEVQRFDIIKDSIEDIRGAKEADFIIHLASIASPTFYRQYPIETLDANIWGLRNLLEFYKDKEIKGFLFFSSSEIYGDPLEISTSETYRGNVSCIGPRACYDESKRFGETICEIFASKFYMPIGIARPFNNYGPGMNIDDRRVPADFAKAIMEHKDIEILSDGSPKRTFCYISDAICGYLKILLHGKFDVFNIGIEKGEISIRELAEIYREVGIRLFGYKGDIKYAKSSDKDYLTHNPSRRCPNLTKARAILNYNPSINVSSGVERFLCFLRDYK